MTDDFRKDLTSAPQLTTRAAASHNAIYSRMRHIYLAMMDGSFNVIPLYSELFVYGPSEA